MRYIPITSLHEGMVLAKPILDGNFAVLFDEGQTLSGIHIQRLNGMGYAGIYIMDDLSRDVAVKDILPANVRVNTIRFARDLWQQAERGGKELVKMPRGQQEKVILPVIESLLANPRRLVELIDLKPEEDYLYYHTAGVVILSILIGVEMGLSEEQLFELGMSALLHDVGTIFVPKAILEKPGKLTPDEYAMIRSHTQKGFEYLRDNFEISIEGCMGALQHHENYDGSGYPNSLKRDKISIYGRIISITDVYDALTSRRPFRRMLYPAAAMDYMNNQAGVMFDPDILAVFQRVVPLYPSGTCVELDSGVRGIVIRNFPADPGRPRIRLINSKMQPALYVDLHEDKNYQNTRVTQIIEL